MLNSDQVEAFFSHIGILKHRAIVTICYSGGLLIKEAVSLKVGHLDPKTMLIRVNRGKGDSRLAGISKHVIPHTLLHSLSSTPVFITGAAPKKCVFEYPLPRPADENFYVHNYFVPQFAVFSATSIFENIRLSRPPAKIAVEVKDFPP